MRLLFVCMGNICRSPLAEGIARHHLAQSRTFTHWQVDSAATHDYHVGHPPDSRSVAVARRQGIDISAQRARRLLEADFARFDWIIGMDHANLAAIEALRPPGDALAQTGLLLDLGGMTRPVEVPDPYYQGPEAFDAVFRLVESAMPGLIKRVSYAHNGA